MAVVVELEGGVSAELLATPQVTVHLPDPDWRAEVQVGETLFSNWCDDVIEAGDATPRADHRWPLRAGTLVVTLPTLADAARAEGRLTGGIVDVDVDGEDLDLPDLRFTNTGWGQFAG